MRWSRLAWVVALYIALDVTNPLMPGALVFDADASVEVPQNVRLLATDAVTPPAPTPAHEEVRSFVAAPRAYIAPGEQIAQVRPRLRGLRPAREDDPPSREVALT